MSPRDPYCPAKSFELNFYSNQNAYSTSIPCEIRTQLSRQAFAKHLSDIFSPQLLRGILAPQLLQSRYIFRAYSIHITCVFHMNSIHIPCVFQTCSTHIPYVFHTDVVYAQCVFCMRCARLFIDSICIPFAYIGQGSSYLPDPL